MAREDSSTHLLRNDDVIRKPGRTLVVEPLILLYCVPNVMLTPVISQYVFKDIGKGHNYSQSGIGHNGSENPCRVNETDPLRMLQKQVEQETAMFSLMLCLSAVIPSLFSSLYIGGYTDYFGRRPGFLFPCLGSFINGVVSVVVVCFELDIHFLFIGSVFYGVFGCYIVFLMNCFSYIADCTTHKSRAFRTTVCELIFVLGGAIAKIGAGFWIREFGFVGPIIFIGCFLFAALSYAFFLVPETVITTPRYTSTSICIIFKNALAVYRRNAETARPTRLKFLLLGFLAIAAVSTASTNVQILLFINAPLCFSSDTIGLISGIASIAQTVAPFIVVSVFLKLFLGSEIFLIFVSCVSGVANYTLLGLANHEYIVWTGKAVGCLSYMGIPLIRAQMSKLVSKTEQGALSAGVAFAEGVTTAVFHSAWALIYNDTLQFYHGFVFFIMALLFVVAVVFIGMYSYSVGTHKPQTRLVDVTGGDII